MWQPLAIVIGPDPVKDQGLGLHGLTWVNPNQPGKIKKFEILIFHMKKLINNPCEYKLYVL